MEICRHQFLLSLTRWQLSVSQVDSDGGRVSYYSAISFSVLAETRRQTADRTGPRVGSNDYRDAGAEPIRRNLRYYGGGAKPVAYDECFLPRRR